VLVARVLVARVLVARVLALVEVACALRGAGRARWSRGAGRAALVARRWSRGAGRTPERHTHV
jgi:hypothetical protein